MIDQIRKWLTELSKSPSRGIVLLMLAFICVGGGAYIVQRAVRSADRDSESASECAPATLGDAIVGSFDVERDAASNAYPMRYYPDSKEWRMNVTVANGFRDVTVVVAHVRPSNVGFQVLGQSPEAGELVRREPIKARQCHTFTIVYSGDGQGGDAGADLYFGTAAAYLHGGDPTTSKGQYNRVRIIAPSAAAR